MYWECLIPLLHDSFEHVVLRVITSVSQILRSPSAPSKLFFCVIGFVLDAGDRIREKALEEVKTSSERFKYLNSSNSDEQEWVLPETFEESVPESVRALYSCKETFRLLQLHAEVCVDISLGILRDNTLLSRVKSKQYALKVIAVLALHTGDAQLESVLTALSECLMDPELESDKDLMLVVPCLLKMRYSLDRLVAVLADLLNHSMKQNRIRNSNGLMRILESISDRIEIGQVLECTRIAVLYPSLARIALHIFKKTVTISCEREEVLHQLIACRSHIGEKSDIELWESVFTRCDRTKVLNLLNQRLRRGFACSSDRLALVVLCKNVNGFVVLDLLNVLKEWAVSEDPLARLDCLEIVASIVDGSVTLGDAETGFLVEFVIDPLSKWRIGQASSKLRKASLSCYRDLLGIDGIVVPESIAQNSFKTILSCLDDVWSPDNRLLALLVLEKLVSQIEATEIAQAGLGEVLKRMDDSQNAIRAQSAKTIEAFYVKFGERLKFSEAKETLKIHANDHSSQLVSESVRDCLTKLVVTLYFLFTLCFIFKNSKDASLREECESLALLPDSAARERIEPAQLVRRIGPECIRLGAGMRVSSMADGGEQRAEADRVHGILSASD